MHVHCTSSALKGPCPELGVEGPALHTCRRRQSHPSPWAWNPHKSRNPSEASRRPADRQTYITFCPWLCGMAHCRRVHNPPWNYTHRADSALSRKSPGPTWRAWWQSGWLAQCPLRNDERQLGVLSPIRDGRTKISFSPSNGESNPGMVGLVFLSHVNNRPEMAFALPHLKT